MSEKDTNPKDAIGTKKWRQFFVVPRQVLWEVGVGMLEGALKYGRHNYRASGVRASVYVDAAIGHLDQFVEGEDRDPDSRAGLSHVTKAICSLVVLRDAMMNDFWVDDRPPKIKDLDSVRKQLQSAVEELFLEHADKNPHHYTEVDDGSDKYRPRGLEVRDPEPFEFPPTRSLFQDPPRQSTTGDLVSLLEELGFTMWYDPKEGLFKAKRTQDLDFDDMTDLGYWTPEDLASKDEMEEGASRIANSIFGSFPDNYTMKTERVGDVEITTIAPKDHPWNASDSDLDDQEILSRARSKDIERDQMKRLLAHAQSSASTTEPILGLSSHALALLDEWRTAGGAEPFDPATPEIARALALRQWAMKRGLL